MEQIGKTLTQVVSHIHVEEQKKPTQLLTQSCVTQECASYKETQNCVNTICTQKDYLDKREYGLLLRTLEEWNTAYPKSICRIYGVQVVKRAIAYTKATPNVRNKGAYCLYMCRQLKSEISQQENHIVDINKKVEEKDVPQSPTSPVKSKKGIFTPPNIINWQEARTFLANLRDTDLEDEEVLIFANQLRKKYNFA